MNIVHARNVVVAAIYARTNNIRALVRGGFFAYIVVHAVDFNRRNDGSMYFRAVCGKLAYFGLLQLAVQRQRERARDRSRRHYYHVCFIALAFELGALVYAEPLLFVNYHKPQIFILYAIAYKRLCADDTACIAVLNVEHRFFFLPRVHRGAQKLCFYAQRLQDFDHSRIMLARKHFRRRHYSRLATALCGIKHCKQGDNGFSATDLALHKHIGELVRSQCRNNFPRGGNLFRSERIRQTFYKIVYNRRRRRVNEVAPIVFQ